MENTNTGPEMPATLLEAVRYFTDADVCIAFLAELRWPRGVMCPRCGLDCPRFLGSRRVWQCRSAHPFRQFSVKVGTIFEDSPLGLDKWLPAVWMIVNDKNGISSYEVARALDVTQKTAWFMLHRIRFAMQRDGDGFFKGDIEVDETFIGGKARNMHHHKRVAKMKGGTGMVGKSAVMGLLERHGPDGHSRVRVKHVTNTRRATLRPEVRQHAQPGATIYTDALASYQGLDAEYQHHVIDHAEAYAKGHIHTNGLENFWSLLKRALKGTYVSVQPFHLFRYLDEQAFRFNARGGNDAERFVDVLRTIVGRRLTYKRLIGEEPAPAM